jgi:hypothetical protein
LFLFAERVAIMKTPRLSVNQLLVLVGVVVVLVFGVTYVALMIGGRGGPATGGGALPVGQEELLSFPFGQKMLPDKGASQVEREIQQPGYYDFWFTNRKDQPVRVGVEKKNCQCARVEWALLPAEQWGKDLTTPPAAANLAWQELTENSGTAEVPAGAAGGIRVSWQAHEQPVFKQIFATLLTESKGKGGVPFRVEADINFVPPVRVLADKARPGSERPNEALVTDMEENSVETATFYCWSSTRDKFSLKIDPPSDPCLSCGDPQPLTAKELEQVGAAHNIHMRCGYRLVATVREQTPDGKKHLDLGYFRRHLTLHPEPDGEPVQAVVVGLVRGELEIGLGDEKNVIRLGSFAVASGVPHKIITLSTEKSDVDLEVADYPPFLAKPKLELVPQAAGGGKTWELTVTIPPNSGLDGPLRDQAVSLKIKGEGGRRIRIPVTGFAHN